MVLEEILTASELRYVMDDIKDDFSPNFVENSVPVQQLMSDPIDNSTSGMNSSQTSDTSGELTDGRPPKRKKMKRCDSTRNAGSTSSMAVDALPCLEAYPGPFNFQLQLPADSSTHRWTYSKVLKKVFIDIDKVLALQFKWNFNEVKNDADMFVRAMPVYTSDDSLNLPVLRCPIHLLHDNPLNIGFQFVEHVMRCEHTSTIYDKDPMSQRFSCRTPLSRPQPGSDTTTLTYKFVCKTSCLSGMNRKPICVIFTLEDTRGVEYGRQNLAVKICSCPKRDKQKEEKNEVDKNESAPRVPTTNESVPSMICSVNNGAVSTTGSNEASRDIKHVICDVNQITHRQSEIHAGHSCGLGIGVLKSNELIIRSINSLDDKMNRILNEMFKDEQHEYSSFFDLKYLLQSRLKDLSLDQIIELREIVEQAVMQHKMSPNSSQTKLSTSCSKNQQT